MQAEGRAALTQAPEPTATSGTPVPAPGADPSPGPRRVGLLGLVAVLALAADIVSKVVAVQTLSDRPPVPLLGDVLELTLVRNSGAAFSLAGSATIVFTLIAVVVVVAIVRTSRRLRSRGWAVSLGLVLGGALGNLTDRLFRAPGPLRGAVVDWIHLTHWPVFNLADSAIVVGGVLAVVLSLSGRELDGRRSR